VYDITNPDEPVWIDAGESPSTTGAHLFTYGNTLFSLDSSYLIVYDLSTQVPTLTTIIPITALGWSLNNGVLYVNPSDEVDLITSNTLIDVYDMTTGDPVHNRYTLPNPSNISTQGIGIAGNGNTLYVSWVQDINNTLTLTIATYDISQSSPTDVVYCCRFEQPI
jgi:hypothetical protein